jgi:hypothetical protein
MKTHELEIYQCIQDSQEYGSDNDHMVSRIFFTLDGIKHACNIRQEYGSKSSLSALQVEVEIPAELSGKINKAEFQEAVQFYYNRLIGSGGSGIYLGEDVTNVRMMDNIFHSKMNFRIHSESFS